MSALSRRGKSLFSPGSGIAKVTLFGIANISLGVSPLRGSKFSLLLRLLMGVVLCGCVGCGSVPVAGEKPYSMNLKPSSFEPLIPLEIDLGLSSFEEDPILLGVLSLAFLREPGMITQIEVSEWGNPLLTRMRLVLDGLPDNLYPIRAVVVTGSREWPKNIGKHSFVLSNTIDFKEMCQMLGYVFERQEVCAGHEKKLSPKRFEAFYVQMPQPDIKWQKRCHVILLMGEIVPVGDGQFGQRWLIRGTIEGVFVRDAKGWRTVSLTWHGVQEFKGNAGRKEEGRRKKGTTCISPASLVRVRQEVDVRQLDNPAWSKVSHRAGTELRV